MSMMKRWMAGTLATVMAATAGAAWAGKEGADDEWASEPLERQAVKGMEAGVQLLRVHDVPETVQAMRVWRGLRDAALTDFSQLA